MPFSQSSQLSTIIQYIEQLNPLSILDIGVGMGQYGFLARINLENLHLFQVEGHCGQQRPKQEWRVQIDGIEGCAVYLTPVHDYCYNHIIIGNALEILPTLPDQSYQLILAIDILEHLTTDEGFTFLSHVKRITQKTALISTPKEFIPQEVVANPYENHRSLWTRDDLEKQDFTTILPNEFSWIAVYQFPQ